MALEQSIRPLVKKSRPIRNDARRGGEPDSPRRSSLCGLENRAFSERAELMKKAAGVLRDKAGEFARLMALEMGKPVRDGRPEIEKCAWVCDHYAEQAEAMLSPEIIATDAG